MNRVRLFVFLLVSFSLIAGLTPTAAQPVQQEVTPTSFTPLTHYIVFEQLSTGTITPVFYRSVELEGALQSLPLDLTAQAIAEQLTPDRLTDTFVATLVDSAGNPVFRTVVEIPRWLRGEFAADPAAGDGTIDPHLFPMETSAFVVRVPVIPGTRLVLEGLETALSTAFDLASIAADSSLALSGFNTDEFTATVGPGSSLNRVDLLVMGDGYTAAQQATFNTNVTNVMNTFFSVTPYNEYRNFVKVSSLFTPSPQSGSDHPPYNASCSYTNPNNPECCSDFAANGDALAGTYVNTAFDASFCAFMVHRLLVVNSTDVLTAAAAYPNWDQILVIVNDATYGGSGGFIGVFSTNGFAVEVAQHEYGHSFTKLADEYETAYPGFPACSDTDGNSFNDCELNVTNQTTRALIKWNRWIDPATPIVTPPTSPYTSSSVIGLFQGARYLTSGMYRPGYNCMMRSLGVPFCAVASEAYPLRLYNGGWGVPNDGISNIELGTVSPSSYAPVQMTLGTTVTFSAGLLGPTGSTLNYRWLVDGVQVTSGSSNVSAAYAYTPGSAGNHTVTLEVIDQSPILHPSVRESVKSTRTWNINVRATTTNMIGNGSFNSPINTATVGNWVSYGQPTPGAIVHRITSGVLEFYRNTGTTQAIILQDTGTAVPNNAVLNARLDIGNVSGVRQRVTVLLHDSDFSDVRVCAFWLAPNTGRRTFQMLTDTTEAWTSAVMAVYASTADGVGWVQLDNVSLQHLSGATTEETRCIDPSTPPTQFYGASGDLIVNGSFDSAVSPWAVLGSTLSQLTGGVLEFYRPNSTPSGPIIQTISQPTPVDRTIEAVFYVGNNSPVRKRVTVLIHASDFTDLAACTFTLAPNTPLQPTAMQMYTTKAWSGISMSIYPATADSTGWYQIDDISLRITSGSQYIGTTCWEPGSVPSEISAAHTRAGDTPPSETIDAPTPVYIEPPIESVVPNAAAEPETGEGQLGE
jgi:hypothetical protein